MTSRRTFPDDMDPACVPACEALCALPGVDTTESCEGHGREPPTIYFRVQSLASLHPIVRAIDRRYYAYSADRLHCVVHDRYDDWWLLRVMETDLIDDRIRFCLTMRDVPEDVGRMLALLAQNVADAARLLADWSAPGKCALSGELVLSTGKKVAVRVELGCPALSRAEEREVESARIPLHDLTPIQVPEGHGGHDGYEEGDDHDDA